MAASGGGPEPVTLDRRFLLLVLVPIGVYMLVAYLILPVTRPHGVIFPIIAADSFPSVAAAEARYRSFWVTAFLLSAAASFAVAVGTAIGLWRLRLARDRHLILSLIVAVILASVAAEIGDDRWYDNLGDACPAAPETAETSRNDATEQVELGQPHSESTETSAKDNLEKCYLGQASQPVSETPKTSANRVTEDGNASQAACTNRDGLFRTVFQPKPCGVAPASTLHLLDTGLDAVKMLGVIALSLVGAGLVLTLAEPGGQPSPEAKARRLKRDLQQQKELLHQGAAVYVLAIIAMLAWMHWPLPYLASDAVRGDYRDLLVANALIQGTAYSLGIAAIYLPAAMLLRRRIADLAESAPDAAPTWLREQGLEAQPFDQLRQMGTVLLPAIIGILPALEKLWN